MKLERLGAFHQTRLSFVRSIIRKMMRENWRIERTLFDLDADGYGTCIYSIQPPGELYSMVVFSQPLDDSERTDRVIAEKWDIACVLCEGNVSNARLEELRVNVPQQETGRNQTDVLVLSRANRSIRNFEYFVDCLSRGEQPDPDVIAKVGYLHRTTAVYGNGKFGVADYSKVRLRSAFATTFSAQMFTVYMIRHFSLEQVEHIAKHRAPATAIPLHNEVKQFVGIGNATGLGMAPFLVNHPKLIHAWLHTREIAIARVTQTQSITSAHMEKLVTLTDKAITHFNQIYTDDSRQKRNNERVCEEMLVFKNRVSHQIMAIEQGQLPTNMWQDLVAWAFHNTSLETQELINSLLLELYPELVDELENHTSADETANIRPEMSLGELKQIIERQYHWALQINFDDPEAQHYFWYRSMEKEEPRLGVRDNEPGAEKEMEVAVSRTVKQLFEHIQTLPAGELAKSIVHFLLKYPVYKGIVRRIQSLQYDQYAEIRSNLIDQSCLPIHLLRCKLACFGASKFDPKSDRWVRITLFQGAPLISEIGQPFADDWCFPCKPSLTKKL
ncbi:MAG: hypothetical protein HOG97_00530 [Candidatus Marinimicrobia bacterium]|nr:hypothetical protein [Candidatus Neomarinimicrobiota bacterium]